jgi:hypothetical protein
MLGRVHGVALAAGVMLVLSAGAVAATPNAATMTLQAGDIAGAKEQHSASVRESGYLAAYDRQFQVLPPYGAGKIVFVENEVAVAASPSTPKRDLGSAARQIRTKAGRAALVAGLARGAHVKASDVTVGKLRAAPGMDEGVELPMSFKTAVARVYANVTFLRLDRVFVVITEAGLRAISRADTARLAALVAGHIKTALTPVNVAPPAITGTPQQGQTLAASTGTWSVDDVTLTYQWQRCDGSGANCVAVPGATQSTYLVSAADVGFTLRVGVTATDRFGAPLAASAPTAPVT